MTSSPNAPDAPQAPPRQPAEHPLPSPAAIEAALRDVIDPELGINVVDLGLVYGIEIDGRHVAVRMTLTTPGCPLHGTITREADIRVGRAKGVRTVDVQLVWDPPWTPERLTEEGKRQLGW